LKNSLVRLAVLMLLCPLLAVSISSAREAPTDFPLILASDLPAAARDTLSLIHREGPFPYAKDGVVFSNREKILPRQPRGFYHEYTVKTPGARNRGALRIVCGGSGRPVCYFSDDHYQTFKQIKE
jgi:ribonuclease T1